MTTCRAHPDFEGKTLLEIARMHGITETEAYIQIVKDGGASVVCRSMKENDIRTLYRQPWVMVASDGGIGSRHPRGAGSFPRVLGRYVRDLRWLTLAEAIRKMTAAPAARLGLSDRGRIRKGMKADLVIFDPRRVIDKSTFKEPLLLSEGINHVFVNGKPVWQEGKVTGNLPGRRDQKEVDASRQAVLLPGQLKEDILKRSVVVETCRRPQFRRRTFGDLVPGAHYSNPIADSFDEAHNVRRYKQRFSSVPFGEQPQTQLSHHLYIEPVEGFVQHQDIGRPNHRRGQTQLLAHTE